MHLTADSSQAEVQRGDCLAESPVFLDVLSSWVMFPLKLTESICYNRCVSVNELSPEIWKWPHGGLLQVEITELASFWISPSIFLKCCELETVWREDKEQNKCCLPASLRCRCTLEQDYFPAGRIEACLAQAGENGRKDEDFIFWMLLLRKSYTCCMSCILKTSVSSSVHPGPWLGLLFEAFVSSGVVFPLRIPPYAWASYTFPIRLLNYWSFHLSFTMGGSKCTLGAIARCLTAWGLPQLLPASQQGISRDQESLVLRAACGKWKSPFWTWYMNRQNSRIAGERKFPTKFQISGSETDGRVKSWISWHQKSCPSWSPQGSQSTMEAKRSVEKPDLDPYFCDQETIFPSLLQSKHVWVAATKKQQEHKALTALPVLSFQKYVKEAFFHSFSNVKAYIHIILLQCNGPKIKSQA